MTLSGGPLDYLIAFTGGFLLSLTPCVYPLIPISVSYIGISSGGSKLRGFILSLIYVTGIALTYSVLGVIASLTGKIFGTISSNPFTYIIFGGVTIIFGLSMFEVIRIPLPGFTKGIQPKKQNYLSTLVLGLTSGLVISPCVTPVLVSILAYLATQKNIFYGASLLFVFAFGMGLIFIAAGVFSSVLLSLPKSGKWMVYMERLCAAILVALGLYFASVGIGRLHSAYASEVQFAPDFKLESLDKASVTLSSFRGKKPVLLLFWTTWCPFCREQLMAVNDKYPELTKQGIEVLAVNIGESSAIVERFVRLRNLKFPFLIDPSSSAAVSFKVMGVPTYVLIDVKGATVLTDNYFPDRQIKNVIAK